MIPYGAKEKPSGKIQVVLGMSSFSLWRFHFICCRIKVTLQPLSKPVKTLLLSDLFLDVIPQSFQMCLPHSLPFIYALRFSVRSEWSKGYCRAWHWLFLSNSNLSAWSKWIFLVLLITLIYEPVPQPFFVFLHYSYWEAWPWLTSCVENAQLYLTSPRFSLKHGFYSHSFPVSVVFSPSLSHK